MSYCRLRGHTLSLDLDKDDLEQLRWLVQASRQDAGEPNGRITRQDMAQMGWSCFAAGRQELSLMFDSYDEDGE